ncbi:hypothetical protein L195_g062085, partial [Trifolium pratense]
RFFSNLVDSKLLLLVDFGSLVNSRLVTLSGGFQKSGGFQNLYLIGLALAFPSRFRTASQETNLGVI